MSVGTATHSVSPLDYIVRRLVISRRQRRILDSEGKVVAVNEAWTSFACQNQGSQQYVGSPPPTTVLLWSSVPAPCRATKPRLEPGEESRQAPPVPEPAAKAPPMPPRKQRLPRAADRSTRAPADWQYCGEICLGWSLVAFAEEAAESPRKPTAEADAEAATPRASREVASCRRKARMATIDPQFRIPTRRNERSAFEGEFGAGVPRRDRPADRDTPAPIRIGRSAQGYLMVSSDDTAASTSWKT